MNDFNYYRPNNFPPIVKNLIIINVLVFVAQLTMENTYQITEKFMLYPIVPEGLKSYSSIPVFSTIDNFQPYQIFTYMFSHSPSSLFHLLFNMLWLWMLGRILEGVWGSKRFLFFYLACGVGAAALHLVIHYFRAEQLLNAIQTNNFSPSMLGALSPMLGASGAIMGIMAAFAYLFPNTPLYIFFFPVPIKAKWFVIAYVAIDLFGGLGNAAGDNIAHFAHLGGAITGFIIVVIWNKTNRKTLY
jgi:membrane associated rhomboid family serine protease